MKKIISTAALLLLLFTGPAFATPISKEQANNYYANCKAQPGAGMRPESHDAMCACTSVKMMEAMTVEDVQAMSSGDKNAQNKMFIEVYAPCMSYPVQDLVGMQCLEDPKIDQVGSNIPKEELCSCIAERTAAWFEGEGRALMRRVLTKNPEITDPVGPVMETPEFKSQTYNGLIACLTETR